MNSFVQKSDVPEVLDIRQCFKYTERWKAILPFKRIGDVYEGSDY